MKVVEESPPAPYTMVVMGGSAGSLKALSALLTALPQDFPLPVLLVQHLHPDDDGSFARLLAITARRPVCTPCDKAAIEPGWVYVAPADYHLLVERSGTIALSTEGRVNWSRPSIDVLFESAALAMGNQVIAVILSGASADGAAGIKAIKAAGGVTIAQDPATADYPLMPGTAIETGAVDEVLPIEALGPRLAALAGRPSPQP